MRRLVTGMTTHKGFTLIEILIVIVIIGITLG
ncbi:prepilin-type N-terminal cleavage/methylation domain-containing protein, partial [Serratia bockelmannii]